MSQVWGRWEGRTGFRWGDLSEGDHLQDLGINGRIILKRISKNWDGGMNWIDLTQDRDRWRAVVNAVTNFQVPQNSGVFLTSWGPVSVSRTALFHVVLYRSPCTNFGIVPQMTSWRLISTSLPICYALIILPFHDMCSSKPSMSLNKPKQCYCPYTSVVIGKNTQENL